MPHRRKVHIQSKREGGQLLLRDIVWLLLELFVCVVVVVLDVLGRAVWCSLYRMYVWVEE